MPHNGKRQVTCDKHCPHMHLAWSAGRIKIRSSNTNNSDSGNFTRPIKINELTEALMNRLWIPDTSTIVGMLSVGLSSSNADELTKWLIQQLQVVESKDIHAVLNILEKRFRLKVDQYPEV